MPETLYDGCKEDSTEVLSSSELNGLLNSINQIDAVIRNIKSTLARLRDDYDYYNDADAYCDEAQDAANEMNDELIEATQRANRELSKTPEDC